MDSNKRKQTEDVPVAEVEKSQKKKFDHFPVLSLLRTSIPAHVPAPQMHVEEFVDEDDDQPFTLGPRRLPSGKGKTKKNKRKRKQRRSTTRRRRRSRPFAHSRTTKHLDEIIFSCLKKK